MTNSSHSQALSVSELNRQARQLLERSFLTLHVEGEISNFARPSSGHWYFTLKDDGAQVRCAMFKNRNQLIKPAPKNGDKVIVRAKVSLYEGRGDYQLICEFMQPAGSGSLQAEYNALKNKLKSEGLFEAAHKKALPTFPTRIGLITSASGAAVHDILTVLKRRFPGLPVVLYPCAVQGEEAPAQLCKALLLAQVDNSCDILVIGRGGGSLEDLWAFNNEQLARAIFDCDIPIVSAVGHEVDVVISDFVADVRAATPSAAAELISPDQQQLKSRLDLQTRRLRQQLQIRINQSKQTLTLLSARLKHPGDRLREQAQSVDHLEHRLVSAMRQRLNNAQHKIQRLQLQLKEHKPAAQIAQQREHVDALKHRLCSSIKAELKLQQQTFAALTAQLHTVSPLATLERGYTITRDQQGKVITAANQIQTNAEIETVLHQGRLICTVKETIEEH